jgi:hypothetical protein
MPLTIEKIAVDAPMPSASVAITASVNDGVFAYARAAYLRSVQSDSTSMDGFSSRASRRRLTP